MTINDLAPIAILAVVGAVLLASQNLVAAVQPLRLRLAEEGERLLGRNDVPQALRREVDFMLDHAFPTNRILLILVFFAMPFLTVYGVREAEKQSAEIRAASRDVRGIFLELRALDRKISLANHPFLMPLIELEAAILMLTFLSVRALVGRGLDGWLDREGVLVAVERKQYEMMPSFRRHHEYQDAA